MSKVNYKQHQKAWDGRLGWNVVEPGKKTHGPASPLLASPFRKRQIEEARFQGVLSNKASFPKSLVSTFFPGLEISFLLEKDRVGRGR